MVTAVALRRYQNYVDGRFVDAQGSKTIPVENPSTGEMISEVPDSSLEDTREAIRSAERAQADWEKLAPIERAGYLHKIATALRKDPEHIARVITEEQGKMLDLARVEVAFTADYIDYMAEWARRIEGEIIESDRPGETIFLFRQPIGVIGGILPWNFPFFLIARKAAPALVTGNTIVIKPSEETPHNAVKFCEAAGAGRCCPPGVVQRRATGAAPRRARRSPRSPRIGMVSFTGSVETGVGGHGGRRHEHHQGEPRARRQGARHRDGRRRYRPRGRGRQGVARHQQRAGVQLRRARLRAASASPTSSPTSSSRR